MTAGRTPRLGSIWDTDTVDRYRQVNLEELSEEDKRGIDSFRKKRKRMERY